MNIAYNAATRSTESPKAEATIKPDFLEDDQSVFQRLLENHLPRVRSIVERIRRWLPSTIVSPEKDVQSNEVIRGFPDFVHPLLEALFLEVEQLI